MNKEETTVKTTETAVPQTTETSTVTTEIDVETRIADLEKEKARLIEEGLNWKTAALKYKQERKNPEDIEETEEEKIQRLVREEIARTRISQIDSEKDNLLAKALKENKELKLASLNKTSATPTSVGTHTEGPVVTSTLITEDQIKALKTRGLNDKDIERYKKNLQKYAK